MSKQTERFVKGALLLSLAGIVAKVVSAFYRIPLVQLVGDEGVGYYQAVYPIFAILISACYIGIPNAISKLIAEEISIGAFKKAQKTFKAACLLSVILGGIVSLLMFVGAHWLIQVSHWDQQTKYVIWGLACAPIFVAISGVLRGYFQGYQMMKPTAIAQIIENFSKVIIGISLVKFFLDRTSNLALTVSGAAIGASFGFVLSTLFMLLVYHLKRGTLAQAIQMDQTVYPKTSFKHQIKRILWLAIPVSIASAVFSIMNAIDSFTLYNALDKIGHNSTYATKMIGQMGNAYSLINLPLTISVAISVSIIPAIAEALAKNNQEELVQKTIQGIKLAIMLALPAAVGLWMLATPIMKLIYPKSMGSAIFLQLFSICLIFMIVGQTLAGILQGIGKQMVPLIALGVAVVVKLALNMVLIPTALEGKGAAVASIAYYVVFLIINFIVLKKNILFKLNKINILVKPLIATVIMIVTVFIAHKVLTYWLNSNAIETLLTVAIGSFFYFMVLLILRTLTREELAFLPKHQKIIGFLEKKKLL